MHCNNTAGPRPGYVKLVAVLLIAWPRVLISDMLFLFACFMCGDVVELHNAFIMAILSQTQKASVSYILTGGGDDKAPVLELGEDSKTKAAVKEEARELLPSVKKGWNYPDMHAIHANVPS